MAESADCHGGRPGLPAAAGLYVVWVAEAFGVTQLRIGPEALLALRRKPPQPRMTEGT